MTNNDRNKPGYKHTPLGWIPEEWDVQPLNKIYDKIVVGFVGEVNSSYCSKEEGIPFIRTLNVKDGYFDPSEIVFVTKKFHERNRKSQVFNDDILIARVGANMGYTCKISKLTGEANAANVIIIKRKTGINSDYYTYFLSSKYGQKQIQVQSGGGAQAVFNTHLANSILAPLPSKHEQTKIAAILSTWDNTIQKTQQLITQLQQRNKGLAQQLLTGKKRLKGFKGEWKKVHADSIFRSVSVKNNGNEMLLSATQERGIIPRDMLDGRVTMPSGDTNSFKLVERGDFVISLRSFQGGIEYSNYRGVVSPAYTVLKPNMPISDSFYKHYFKSYDFIGHLAVAVIGIRDGKQISYDDFSFLKLPNPSLEEQYSIADVLDKANEELKQQEQYLAALQLQKKGLMQKLLTGEVRVKH